MLQIAIVEDIKEERSVLKSLLQEELSERKMEYHVTEFESGKAFLDTLEKSRFKIIFLDIYMEGIDGMEVARRMSAQWTGCKIVFFSSSIEHISQSFLPNVASYLLKPVKAADLKFALAACLPRKGDDNILPVKTGKKMELICRDDIIYIDFHNHTARVHTIDGIWKSYTAFTELTAPLTDDNRFLTCRRGVLVNLQFIKREKDGDFIMQNGEHLPISRGSRNSALDTWRRYKLDRM